MELKAGAEHDEPQELYARWLDAGTRGAFAISAASLLVYLSGAAAPFVPLQALPELWTLPVGQFLERTGAPSGWGWITLIGYGDYLNLIGICLFALVSISCYARILPALLRRGERLHAGIALAQVAVLAVAACGIFA